MFVPISPIQGEAHEVLQSDRTQTIDHILKCFRKKFQCSRRPLYSTILFFIGGGAEATSVEAGGMNISPDCVAEAQLATCAWRSCSVSTKKKNRVVQYDGLLEHWNFCLKHFWMWLIVWVLSLCNILCTSPCILNQSGYKHRWCWTLWLPKFGGCFRKHKKVHKMVLADHKWKLREIAATLKISEGNVFTILHENLSIKWPKSKMSAWEVSACVF